MNWNRCTFVVGAVALATGSLTGCGANYKTRPHDMDVRGHESAAAHEEVLAKESQAFALTARVHGTEGGPLVVELRAADRSAALELLQRARMLASR
jgi:hypothetical protein